jgi:hypothetical protein
MFDDPEGLARIRHDEDDAAPDSPRARILRVLTRAARQPFTKESMKAYEKKQYRSNTRFPEHWAAAMVLTCLSVMLAFTPGRPLHPIGDVIFGILALLVVGKIFADKFLPGRRVSWTNTYFTPHSSWELGYELRERGVPVDFHRTASAILDAVPFQSATFTVRSLMRGSEVIDPFLGVKIGDEEIYFAVWQETYEPKRE